MAGGDRRAAKARPAGPAGSALRRLALGRRVRGRKESVDPRLPRRRLARGDGLRLRAVEIETNRQADLVAHRDGQEVRDARGRLFEANEEFLVILVDDPVDHTREPRRAGPRLHALSLGQTREAERVEESAPARGLAARAHGQERDRVTRLPAEVREIDSEDAEERRPALL